MANRRKFIQQTGLLASAFIVKKESLFTQASYADLCHRPKIADRKFVSEAVEQTILRMRKQIKDPALACLFENCFPNTLDTTVDFEVINGKPDTFVITGDIDAMWLRDSTAQVWPYLALIKEDAKLKELIAGVINRQKKCILLDPYANAFYKDKTKISEWSKDITKMQPGIHERKWEIDSLCYPIRLAYHYWKKTGDDSIFDAEWEETIRLTVQTFKEQQRKENQGPYSFQRITSWATDGVPISGYGYPVNPVGLICSTFRPSDDATLFGFLIPSNFFAVVALEQAAEMVSAIRKQASLANTCSTLASEVKNALQKHAVVKHARHGNVYAYEVNGYGSFHLMDDANVPSLLSLPYLQAVKAGDPIYTNTRKLILSSDNPFYYKGKAAEGIGGPHGGLNTIWPISITMRGLTSSSMDEVKQCIQLLKTTHAGTGFMHEAFDKDDPTKFTRKWFAWANTLFGEFILDAHHRFPGIL